MDSSSRASAALFSALSVASGVLLMAVPRRLGRLYGLPQRARLLRLLGARDVGVGWLIWRDDRLGLLARAASDIADAALIIEDGRRGRSRLVTGARVAIAASSALLALRLAARGRAAQPASTD